MTNAERPPITNYATWRRSDGTEERIERSLLRDAETLGKRWASHAIEVMGEADADRLLMPGVNAYIAAGYEEALGWFARCLESHPALASGLLYTHVHFCRRVLATELDDRDLEYRGSLQGGWLGRLRMRKSPMKERCKWCGHYTTYLNPHLGDGYRGKNACERCGWSFPMPEFGWDSPDGLAYSFYRGSFEGTAFYDWFESMFDVSPGRDHYMEKPACST